MTYIWIGKMFNCRISSLAKWILIKRTTLISHNRRTIPPVLEDAWFITETMPISIGKRRRCLNRIVRVVLRALDMPYLMRKCIARPCGIVSLHNGIGIIIPGINIFVCADHISIISIGYKNHYIGLVLVPKILSSLVCD